MTTWTDVTPTTTAYSDQIAADGYVAAGYWQRGYVDGTDQWSVTSASTSTWSNAGAQVTNWGSVSGPATAWKPA